jgi:hypothetical protein
MWIVWLYTAGEALLKGRLRANMTGQALMTFSIFEGIPPKNSGFPFFPPNKSFSFYISESRKIFV